MSDTRISELPVAAALADADLLPVVQGLPNAPETRRGSMAQLRAALAGDRAVQLRDFGAAGDGVTDDAPAIQAAIDALRGKGGGTLLFGPRHYRIASPVVVDGVSVTLQGAGFTEGPAAADGTWLIINATGFTPFTFTGEAARGSAVRDLAVRQTHGAAQVAGWAPTNYDYVFRVVDCFGAVDFHNLFLCAVNRGILCDNSGRLNIQRLRGQVFTCGVEIERCYDIPRIHHVHFWNFWTSNQHLLAFQQQNMDALLFRRCDGAFLDDIFTLGCRSMLRFASSPYGVTTKFYLGSGYADFARYGVWVEGDGVTGQIANLTTQGEIFNGGGAALPGSSGVRLDGNGAQIQVGNLRVDDCERNAVRVNGQANRLDIFAFRAEVFNTLNDGAAAVHLADAPSGTPNQVFLGSPPLLGNGNGGPLVNGATNGHVALMAPGGRQARPGLMVGATDSGFYAPSGGELAAVAGGKEVLRTTSSGTVTIGGAPGANGLGVTTPANAVNEFRVTAGGPGQPVTAAAQGMDPGITLRLQSKGSGTVQLTPRGLLAFEASAVSSTVNSLRVTGASTGNRVRVAAQGADSSVGLDIAGKGAGTVAIQSAGANALVAANPAGAVNHVQVSGSAAGSPPTISPAGSDTTADLQLSGRGAGGIRLQANGKVVVKVDDAGGGANASLALRGTAGMMNLVAEGAPADVGIALAPKGAGMVSAAAPLQLPVFTVASLPPATGYPRCIAFVSDGAGGRRLAVSDGSAWRWPDGSAVA